MPEIALSKVDLPAPLVPIIPNMSPFSSSKEIFLSAQNSTYSFKPISLKSPVIYRIETFFALIIDIYYIPLIHNTRICDYTFYK